MKPILTILSLAALAILTACVPRSRGDRTGWSLVDPEADSLTQLIEYELLIRTSPDTIEKQISRLRSWEGLEDRADIFRSYLYRRQALSDSSKYLLEKIRRRTDSVSDPYLWSRLRLSEIRHVEDHFEWFLVLNQSIDYYRRIGDSLMLANSLVDMSNLMSELKMHKNSLKFLTEAQQIYKVLGMPEVYTRCDINRATLLGHLGRMEEQDSINLLLVNDKTLIADTFTRELVLRNIFISSNDMSYILEDYEMMKRIPRARGLLPLLRRLMAEGYSSLGDADSAARYSRMAFLTITPRHRAEVRMAVYRVYAMTLESEGKADSACMLYRRINEMADSIEEANNSAEIIRLDSNSRIARYEQEVEQRKRIERLHWMAGIMVLMIVSCVMAFLLYRRNQKEKYKKIEAELELDESRRHIAATLIAMEEKDKLLNKMRSNLGKMNAADTTVRQMENLIKIHEAGREDRETFADIFKKISPVFVNNLRETYPDLSERYVKLASYIYAGLTNHQIATAMMVRLESVHQQRWRLRNKMGLDSDTTLEDELHRLGKDSRQR